MRCAWNALLNVLPLWMRDDVDRVGKDQLLELRLRVGGFPQLILMESSFYLDRTVTQDDLNFCVNTSSNYSPWAATTAAYGYVTAPGGHRIGICGNATIHNGQVSGVSEPTSVCVRVARDFPGIAKNLHRTGKSILIIGKPGSGKTTLLRDLIRQRSNYGTGSICVVDEKREVFPLSQGQLCFNPGKQTDILSGCSKTKGIEILLRNMAPDTIAVDEITAEADCKALLHAGWCGVDLIATAHAGNRDDLFTRSVYKSILNSSIFDTLVILRSNKTWSHERLR